MDVGDCMDRLETGGSGLAQRISSMSPNEVCQFIRRESRKRQLSATVRALNHDALSEDLERRKRAEDAIRKLGFL